MKLYNHQEMEAYALLDMITTVIAKIQVYDSDTMSMVLDMVPQYCGSYEEGRVTEAAITQFIQNVRNILED